MLRILIRGFLAVTLLLCTNLQAMQDSYTYVVSGRAVDERGQPVPRASIVVVAESSGDLREIIYGVQADGEGRFRFEEGERTTEPQETRLLYITGERPSNAYAIITPPFDELPHLEERKYAGRIISIRKNGELDLGDVPVQVYYGVITIQLQNQIGAPLITNAEAWEGVWLRVRNLDGDILTERGLSISNIRRTVNLNTSTLTIALPEGRWHIEVSVNGDEGPWLTSGAAVTTNRSGCLPQIILRQNTAN
jgi:hypothetical protein